MTILNLIMIFISFALLLLCMLAPLRKSAAVQKRPSLKMLFKPHGIYGVLLLIVSAPWNLRRAPADRLFSPWDPVRK